MAAPLDPRLLRRSRATRGALAVLVAVGVLQAAATIAQAWLLALVVADLVGGGDLSAQTGRLALLAASLALRGLLAAVQQRAAHRAAAAVKSQLREELLRARLRRPSGTDTSGGAFVALVTRGVEALDGWFSGYLPQLVLAVVVPAVVGLAIGLVDLTSLVVVVLTLPLIPMFMVLVGLVTRDRLDARWRAQSRLGHHFADLVAGLPTLQVLGRARAQVAGLRRIERRHEDATLQTLRVAFLSALVLELLATLSVALVAVGIGLRVVEGELSLLTGLVVLVLAPEVYLPLRQVGARYHDAADGMAAAEQAFALLDAPAPVAGSLDPGRGPGVLEVSGVTLSRGEGVLVRDLSFRLAPGEVVALAGPSGVGKTTLVAALLGHLLPDGGRITVDGVPLAELDPTAWRRHVAWVGQDAELWPSTVGENVALGAPGAPVSRVRAALDRAGAPSLPLEQPVAPDGTGLSAGEQRRVALARALLAIDCGGARLLLLDEPTAGLDVDTEADVVATLRRLGVAVLVVSHRTPVLAAADRVVPLTRATAVATTATTGGRGADGEGSPDDGRDALVSQEQGSESRPEGRGPGPVSGSGGRWENSSEERGGGSTGRDTGPGPRPATGPATAESPGPTAALTVRAAALAVGAAAAGVALMATSAWLLARASEHPPVLYLLVAVTGVRFFGLSRGVLRYLDRLASHRLGLRHQAAARLQSYAGLVGADVVGRRLGDLVARLVDDTEAAQDRVVRVRLPLLAAWAVGLAAVVGFALLVPAAGLVLLVHVVLAGAVWPVLAARVSARSDARIARLRGVLSERVLLAHRHARLLQATGAEALALEPARQADAEVRRAEQRAATARGLGQLAAWLTLAVVEVALLVVAGRAVAAGTLAPILLAVVALTPLALQELLLPLVEAAQTRLRTRAALVRVREVAEGPALDVPPPPELGRPGLRLRGLSVGRDVPLLEPLDLDVGPGARIVLVGPSGVGKSTLVATLLGRLAPLGGSLAVGGPVGCLTQDAHLFDTTVAENVRLGRPGASEQEVRQALAAVGLALEPDRMIGEHGSRLSGGEARRVALARLLLAAPATVILDEPTEHLDAGTARALLCDVDVVWSSAPVVAVSHQPEVFLDAWGGTVQIVAVTPTGSSLTSVGTS